jgi:hypothetical protein
MAEGDKGAGCVCLCWLRWLHSFFGHLSGFCFLAVRSWPIFAHLYSSFPDCMGHSGVCAMTYIGSLGFYEKRKFKVGW